MKSARRTPSRTPPQLSAGRRHLFAFITFSFPFLLLLGVEGGLRLAGYGPDLDLFTTETLHGRVYHIMNPSVKDRYFYSVRFQPTTSPDYFLVPKSPGTFRIMCLGGSTTVGFPYYYNVSFSSFLRDRLHRLFPDRSIDVINVGMTATNSYTALDMARDALAFEPDLFIVYDGHNEFYGALGTASRESFGSSRSLALLYLRAIHLRTFLLLRDLYTGVAGWFAGPPEPDPAATMMSRLARGRHVALDSDTYRACLEAFQANMEGIRDIAAAQGIPVIFGTQVSNIRTQPPFVSAEPERGHAEHLERTIRRASQLLASGAPDSALSVLAVAKEKYPHHAGAVYLTARCLDTLGRSREARIMYERARDLDMLRFRTSSDFNRAILAMDNGTTTACADMERAFRDASPDSLIGNELILEHLHPTSYGYFLLAREYARVMRARGFLASSSEWALRDTVSDGTLWNARHVTEVDERIAHRRTEVLTASWPFRDEVPVVDAIAPDDTLGLIADQVARGRLFWHQAHQDAFLYYELRNDHPAMERELRTLINQLPVVEVQPYLRLARLLLDQDRIDEVHDILLQSLSVQPTILAYRALGDIALNLNRNPEAIAYYEKTFLFPQSPAEQADNGFFLALAYYRSGSRAQASSRLQKVLEARPGDERATRLLNHIRGREAAADPAGP